MTLRELMDELISRPSTGGGAHLWPEENPEWLAEVFESELEESPKKMDRELSFEEENLIRQKATCGECEFFNPGAPYQRETTDDFGPILEWLCPKHAQKMADGLDLEFDLHWKAEALGGFHRGFNEEDLEVAVAVARDRLALAAELN